MNTIGKNVARLLEEKKWTYEDLANKSGLALCTIYSTVEEKTIPRDSTIMKLARAFDVPCSVINQRENRTRINNRAKLTIAPAIERLLRERKMTIGSLAKETGLCKATIVSALEGKRIPAMATVKSIAEALRIPVETLYQCSENEEVIKNAETTAERIRILCTMKGWNLEDLAEHAEMAYITVADLIYKRQKTKTSTKKKIAQTLEIDYEKIFVD